VLEAHIFGGAARKDPLYGASSRTEEFAEFLEIEGLGDVVKK